MVSLVRECLSSIIVSYLSYLHPQRACCHNDDFVEAYGSNSIQILFIYQKSKPISKLIKYVNNECSFIYELIKTNNINICC